MAFQSGSFILHHILRILISKVVAVISSGNFLGNQSERNVSINTGPSTNIKLLNK